MQHLRRVIVLLAVCARSATALRTFGLMDVVSAGNGDAGPPRFARAPLPTASASEWVGLLGAYDDANGSLASTTAPFAFEDTIASCNAVFDAGPPRVVYKPTATGIVTLDADSGAVVRAVNYSGPLAALVDFTFASYSPVTKLLYGASPSGWTEVRAAAGEATRRSVLPRRRVVRQVVVGRARTCAWRCAGRMATYCSLSTCRLEPRHHRATTERTR